MFDSAIIFAFTFDLHILLKMRRKTYVDASRIDHT